MKTITLFLFMCISPVFACSDSWTSTDKVTHFGVGFTLGAVGTAVTTKWYWGTGLGVAAGTMKELADHDTPGNHFCWKDWTWTAAGAFLGSQTCRLAVKVDRISRANKVFEASLRVLDF